MERTKPMNQMSPKQRKRFAARGILHPGTTFLPPSPSSKPAPRRADTGPDQATVDLVLERDCLSCVLCGDQLLGERGFGWSIHHRKLRSQGGDNRLSNLVAVCGHGTSGCHRVIHHRVAKALQGGWLLKSTAEPAAMSMQHSQFGLVLLDDRGGLERTDRRPGDA